MELINQKSINGINAEDTIIEDADVATNDIDYTHALDSNDAGSLGAHSVLGDSASFANDAIWGNIGHLNSSGPSHFQLGDLGSAFNAGKALSFNEDADIRETNGLSAMTHRSDDISTVNGLPHFSSTDSVDMQTDDKDAKESRQTTETQRARSSVSSKSSNVIKVERSNPTDDGDPLSKIVDFGTDFAALSEIEAVASCQSCRKSRNGFGADIPRSSIPESVPRKEYARQCILAAYSSRLNPYALHPGEFSLFHGQITCSQATIYLNIRNAILRLWTRNPLLRVSYLEALGCVRDRRHFELARVAYLWLVRSGFVNFGCVENDVEYNSAIVEPSKRRTVVVVGAGMAGLGCARQLNGLFTKFATTFARKGEKPPRIIVIEGRNRIGGRIYSHPLRKQAPDKRLKGFRATAEMGAQIITGFENGNPLNAIVRGQLALPYHSIRDDSILFDFDGTCVDKDRDTSIERLYNDILEKVSIYRHKPDQESTIEGERRYIDMSKDPYDDEGSRLGTLFTASTVAVKSLELENGDAESNKTSNIGTENNLHGTYIEEADNIRSHYTHTATSTSEHKLLDAARDVPISLDDISCKSRVTLGEVMDEAVRQYQRNLGLSTQDLRLLNWHNANLEYANAANINQLSLEGWDQDIGNEFEGEHTEIIGGYLQVLRGLLKYPTELDVRLKHQVKKVICRESFDPEQKPVSLECSNGSTIGADYVIMTTPLGVLKAGSIKFEPSLPSWKNDCIQRIGFGLLNKIVLVYEEVFWEEDRDMFGLLNQSIVDESLMPEDYAAQRGRFYLFWNCTKTSGAPVLIALMAGNSAIDIEKADTESIIMEITLKLQKMYPSTKVPQPSETIITKWQKDPMAKGSYSYVAPDTLPGDYGLMAKPVGPIHFAGEATCGSHPATVHGAYLSGLRAASEVLDHMIGTISAKHPLVEARVNDCTCASNFTSRVKGEKEEPRFSERKSYQAAISNTIEQKLGRRPTKPARTAANPYLLFQKDYWFICKAQCDKERQSATQNSQAKASRNTIRAALGQRWRSASDEVKRPYLKRARDLKENIETDMNAFRERLLEWDRDAERLRETYGK